MLAACWLERLLLPELVSKCKAKNFVPMLLLLIVSRYFIAIVTLDFQ
jgi:hypothetical protein